MVYYEVFCLWNIVISTILIKSEHAIQGNYALNRTGFREQNYFVDSRLICLHAEYGKNGLRAV